MDAATATLARSMRPSGEPRHLSEHTGTLEASFSSKLVHTVDPTMSVLDRLVLENRGLQRTMLDGTVDCRSGDACAPEPLHIPSGDASHMRDEDASLLREGGPRIVIGHLARTPGVLTASTTVLQRERSQWARCPEGNQTGWTIRGASTGMGAFGSSGAAASLVTPRSTQGRDRRTLQPIKQRLPAPSP